MYKFGVFVATLLSIAYSQLPCICPSSYDPVIGPDGITYHNKCVAECYAKNNISSINDGSNKAIGNMLCLCGRNYDPVCGSNGVAYSNLCELECARSEDPSITKVEGGTWECDRNKKPPCVWTC